MSTKREVITTATAAGAGGAAGGTVIAISGLHAAGMVGSGAGIGSAAGPVGVVVGAVAGVAALTVARTANNVQKDPGVRSFVKGARRKVGHWISGDDAEEQE